jgi:hypothetical protein
MHNCVRDFFVRNNARFWLGNNRGGKMIDDIAALLIGLFAGLVLGFLAFMWSLTVPLGY